MADSVDTIADASGVPRSELLSIWDRVRANQARLEACHRHDFVALQPEKPMGGKFQCSACGGDVDHHAVWWYRKGLAHGAQ